MMRRLVGEIAAGTSVMEAWELAVEWSASI